MKNKSWEEIDRARLQFLRKTLPMTENNDKLIEFVRALAGAIGDVSFDEALIAFNKFKAEDGK